MDRSVLKSVGPAPWQIISVTKWKQPELTEQGVTRVSTDRLGLLCGSDFVHFGEVILICVCNFTTNFNNSYTPVPILYTL